MGFFIFFNFVIKKNEKLKKRKKKEKRKRKKEAERERRRSLPLKTKQKITIRLSPTPTCGIEGERKGEGERVRDRRIGRGEREIASRRGTVRLRPRLREILTPRKKEMDCDFSVTKQRPNTCSHTDLLYGACFLSDLLVFF